MSLNYAILNYLSRLYSSRNSKPRKPRKPRKRKKRNTKAQILRVILLTVRMTWSTNIFLFSLRNRRLGMLVLKMTSTNAARERQVPEIRETNLFLPLEIQGMPEAGTLVIGMDMVESR